MDERKPVGIVIGLFSAFVLLLVFWFGFNFGSSGESRGFRLPEGNLEAGMVAFTKLGCGNCHSVEGEPQFSRPPEYKDLVVHLGGKVFSVKTYGELVTAIIHPKESVRPGVHAMYLDAEGNSIMPDLTPSMTTRELIDIVAFLQEHYEIVIPNYPPNYYPYGVSGGLEP